eukprot:gnl/MRDRNA2_/MRDRNA2_105848_c0_seq1.p1 gnl/MRDRNA2_/MRDRNA2_105848_c0~~gnl/MRDRNA2_/MRDRNA2_105848_c0_seq1.p1  ORF type:complete len:213 (+),score=60.40 gnl/MRDRNA2_/MRDRNA2_105848_c0_seq1:74-712(+)
MSIGDLINENATTLILIPLFVSLATLVVTFGMTLLIIRTDEWKAATRPKASSTKSKDDFPPLSPSQIEEFQEMFALFDIDNSGSITAEELGTVMRSMGHYPSDAELHAMVAKVDVDKSGAIHFDEFLQLMVTQMQESQKSSNQAEEFLEAFKTLDRDGNGYVDATELRYFMLNHGSMKLTAEEVDILMSDADVDGDCKLDFEEFIKMMMAND